MLVSERFNLQPMPFTKRLGTNQPFYGEGREFTKNFVDAMEEMHNKEFFPGIIGEISRYVDLFRNTSVIVRGSLPEAMRCNSLNNAKSKITNLKKYVGVHYDLLPDHIKNLVAEVESLEI